MKAHQTPSFDDTPRLACRIVRACCEVTGRGVTRHVAGCPSCQAYFQSVQDLERELRDDARRESLPVSTGNLEQQILRAVRTARAETPVARSSVHRSIWAAAGCATLAAFAVLILGPTRNTTPPVSGTSPNQDAAAIASLIKSASSELVETVIPSAGQLVAENPLQRELGSVYSDVRSALDFLALNFSPAMPLPEAAPPPRTI